MKKYMLRFWFEHGGTCIWGMNDNAQEKYGYAIENSELPISKALIGELNALESEYTTYLDWEYPPNQSPWTEEQKTVFLSRANMAYEKLKCELGSDYDVKNEAHRCVL